MLISYLFSLQLILISSLFLSMLYAPGSEHCLKCSSKVKPGKGNHEVLLIRAAELVGVAK